MSVSFPYEQNPGEWGSVQDCFREPCMHKLLLSCFWNLNTTLAVTWNGGTIMTKGNQWDITDLWVMWKYYSHHISIYNWMFLIRKKVLYLYKHKKLGINSFEAHSKSLNFFLNVKPRQNGPPAPTYDRCCLDSRKHKNKYWKGKSKSHQSQSIFNIMCIVKVSPQDNTVGWQIFREKI